MFQSVEVCHFQNLLLFREATNCYTGGEWWLGIDYIHPTDEYSADGYSRPQNFEHMKQYFKDYVLFYHKIMAYTKEANVWRITETMPTSWVSKSGQVVIIGDAAHAAQPYVGQVSSH
jgi:hypothetical protein